MLNRLDVLDLDNLNHIDQIRSDLDLDLWLVLEEQFALYKVIYWTGKQWAFVQAYIYIFPLFSLQNRYWYFLCQSIFIWTTIFMNSIIRMGKLLALISTFHSRKAFSFICAKVIPQFFTTIELYSGDMTSCYWNAKGFWSWSSDTSIDSQREAILVRRARIGLESIWAIFLIMF